MEKEIYLGEDLVLLSCKAKSSAEVIKMLGRKMKERGFVKETYVAAVLKREVQFPTGLEIGVNNVAIPHTEAKHVNNSCIGVAILKTPITFKRMDNPDKQIQVKIVFLIALKDGHDHMNILKNIMIMCRNEKILSDLTKNQDLNSVEKILEKQLFA